MKPPSPQKLKARLAFGEKQYQQSMDPDVMDAYPAWELFHFSERSTAVDWHARWDAAGGRLYNGKMIALKTDPVWALISDFGKPHPPFDADDVMEVNEVSWVDAHALCLV